MHIADLINCDTYYFKDEMLRVHVNRSQITVTDITNALKHNKKCMRYYFCLNWKFDGELKPCEVVEMATGCDTIAELAEFLRAGKEFTLSADGCYFVKCESVSSNHVYSPFAKVKPIEIPNKWRVSHIWKAILAGQIKEAHISQILTDDYAHDYAVNYHSGERFDLGKFAEDLIEDPSGWSVYQTKYTEKGLEISIACHTFDFRKLLFVEAV